MIAERRFPVVTVLLIAANMLAAFALVVSPDLAYEFGFRPNDPSVRTAFTSLFLHANLLHLLGNMIFLAAVGAAVELATGSVRFASVYFLSGLVGVAFHYLIARNSAPDVPYIGASGAIAGCAAYYSVRYTGLRVPIAPRVALSVATVTGVWLLLQAVGAFVRFGQSGGVAFWAHLGGFATGALLSLVFRAPDLGQVRLGHEVLDRMNDRGPVAAAEAARRHLEDHPADVRALNDLARAQALLDDVDGEAETILRLLDFGPEDEAPALLGRLIEIGRAERLSSHRRALSAEKYGRSHPALARKLLKSVIEGPDDDPQRPEALLALAALEREAAPARAGVLLDELRLRYPLHPCMDLARKRGWVE